MNTEERLTRVLNELGLTSSYEPHTKDTPRRLLRYLKHWTGWAPLPPFKVTTFKNEDPKVDQMIHVPKITFWSCCSHHLLPFFGEVSISYVPNQKLMGLSKFAQIVRWRAQKPQVQEHLAEEIAAYLEGALSPDGLGVYIRAWHTCQLLSVGPGAPQMVTTVVRGALKEFEAARAEFLREVR